MPKDCSTYLPPPKLNVLQFVKKNSCHKIIHVHAHISVGKVINITILVSCGGYTEPAETKVIYHLVHVK